MINSCKLNYEHSYHRMGMWLYECVHVRVHIQVWLRFTWMNKCWFVKDPTAVVCYLLWYVYNW